MVENLLNWRHPGFNIDSSIRLLGGSQQEREKIGTVKRRYSGKNTSSPAVRQYKYEFFSKNHPRKAFFPL